MNTQQLCQADKLFMTYQGLVLYSEWKVMALRQITEENGNGLWCVSLDILFVKYDKLSL